jgi:hypothetical protein
MNRKAKRRIRKPLPPGGISVSGLFTNLREIARDGGSYTLFRQYEPVAKITVEPFSHNKARVMA